MLFFVLDSGTSYFSCSDHKKMKETHEVVPNEIETANDTMIIHQKCTVKVTFDTGLEVCLNDAV